jgi:hypothetical protein
MMKFIPGRHSGCDYKKLRFFHFRIGAYGFDAYLLVFKPYQYLEAHKDLVKNAQHHRINIRIWGKYATAPEYLAKRIVLFRPDLLSHGMVTFSKTILLSLGMAKFKPLEKQHDL